MPARRCPSPCEPPPHLDGVANPLERVVGVDEQDGVGGHRTRVGAEGLQLVVEEHDPAVGVRALHRDAVQLAGEHVGGPGHPAHVGRAGRRQGAVDPLGAPQPELDHRLPPGREHRARRLGGDEGLEVHDGEQRGLEQHAGDDRPADPDQGLVREDHRALGNRVDVHVELEGAEPVEEGRLEEGLPVGAHLPGQEGEVVLRERVVKREVDGVGQAGRHRVAALERVAPERQVEDRLLPRHPALPRRRGHGELVEVGEERQRSPVHLRGAHEVSTVVLTPAGAM